MPELPEVETCCRGIAPFVTGHKISQFIIREHRLRLPIPKNLSQSLMGLQILSIERRGKYLLFTTKKGTLLIHLGMSGSLRIVTKNEAPQKHDHFEIHFNNKHILRYRDPRRFGLCLWLEGEVFQHPLLNKLGPEPLSSEFNASYLHPLLKSRKASIKSIIMNSHIVVGVGNIYANEALFHAGIHPSLSAERLSKKQCERLTIEIKSILHKAIQVGGTTLRDFVDSVGKPGYFKQQLLVYGRGGESCYRCKTVLNEIRISQRSTVFCRKCQPI